MFADRWHARYIAPLLAADPRQLDEPLAALAEAIRAQLGEATAKR